MRDGFEQAVAGDYRKERTGRCRRLGVTATGVLGICGRRAAMATRAALTEPGQRIGNSFGTIFDFGSDRRRSRSRASAPARVALKPTTKPNTMCHQAAVGQPSDFVRGMFGYDGMLRSDHLNSDDAKRFYGGYLRTAHAVI
jgi:hypothetical protein